MAASSFLEKTALLDEQICFSSTARVLGDQACASFKSILQPSTLVREPKALGIETAVLLQRFMEELIQAAVFVGPLVTFVFQPLLNIRRQATLFRELLFLVLQLAMLFRELLFLVLQLAMLFRELLFLVSQLALSVGCGLNVLLTLPTRLSTHLIEKRKTRYRPFSMECRLKVVKS